MCVDIHGKLVVQVPPDPSRQEYRQPTDVLAVYMVVSCASPAFIFPEPVVCATAEEGLDPRPGSYVGGVERLADRALHHGLAGSDASLSQVSGGEMFMSQAKHSATSAHSTLSRTVFCPIAREMVVELQLAHCLLSR